jgi:hypothetical protein
MGLLRTRIPTARPYATREVAKRAIPAGRIGKNRRTELASPDYSRSYINPKRKRGGHNHLPSLTLRVGIVHRVADAPGP